MRLTTVAAAPLLLSLLSAPAHADDTWTTPHPGVRYLLRTTATPRRIVATQIDLCASGVRVRATQTGERRRTTSSFARLVGAQVAVNADFFSFNDYSTRGLAIGNGARWPGSSDPADHGFLAFGSGRSLLSPPQEQIDPPPSWMREAVGGNLQVLTRGTPIDADVGEFCTTRHPRTVAGFSEDGNTLILAVIDGRTSSAVGMRCTEMGALMKELGAYDALNLDGGGSSAMYIDGRGTVNRPSDGNERTVANHLAIFATGSGEPGSCDRSVEESALGGDAYDASTTTDVDGDGKADLCARSADGIQCALSSGESFAVPFDGPALSDASGWADVSNYGTLRMGDLNGDGKADLCARANAGIVCWLSLGTRFSAESIEGPPLADESGWSHPAYYGSLRLADFNGDGRDDLCVRSARDFRCYPSTGAGFGEAVTLDAIDSATYSGPEHYGTLRVADVNGDGKADVCIRGADGVSCWPSTGVGFGPRIEGPTWSDASGWSLIQFWSTIRLADVDGDGKADLCARAAKGMICHLSTGVGFGPALDGPEWSDASGWGVHQHYSTIRLADIDGDGDLDLCARAGAGVTCAPWTGAGFGAAIGTSLLANENGWGAPRFYSTLRFADVNGDRRADLCARSSAGMRCYLADGTSFSSEAVSGPAWSDATGWSALAQYSTLRVAGPRCAKAEICGNGKDDDCNGAVDDGCDGDTPIGSSSGNDAQGDGGADPRSPLALGQPSFDEAGCGCRAATSPRVGAGSFALAALALLLARRGARRSR